MRTTVTSGSPFESVIGQSRAIRAGNQIYVAGTAPLDANGNTICLNDPYGQTARCLQIVVKAIEDLGGSVQGLVRTRIWLKDMSHWEEAARAHRDLLYAIKPACTVVQITRFIREDWLVEVEAECMVPT